MLFFHLADLHLGKSVNRFSMLPDQQYILDQVLSLADAHSPAAVVLAGDIYDRVNPPVEAVRLYDSFLTELSRREIAVLCIAGNHDSADRLGFAGRLLQSSRVYSFGSFDGKVPFADIEAGAQKVRFHLLPFIRPASVRRFFQDETVNSYQKAVQLALQTAQFSEAGANVLVAHQFVTAGGEKPEQSDSELKSVGGVDEVDAGLFAAFDYVALGHIHGAQKMGRAEVRYAGSPLKYSFSEKGHQKSLSLVRLEGKKVDIEPLALKPLHDMREISGPLDALLGREVVAQQNCEDYLRVVLTDPLEIPDAIGKLRAVYPNVMEIGYEKRQRQALETVDAERLESRTAAQLFAEFYEEQNEVALNKAQQVLVEKLLGDEVVKL